MATTRDEEEPLDMPLEQLMSLGSARPIVRWGEDDVLHRPARRVTDFGPDLWKLLCDMFATNTAADGAGLAAPQIGVDLAVFVYECHDAFGRERRGLVCNPTIALAAEPEEEILGEGCLSLPGAYLPVSRPGFAVCHGYNQFGEPIKVAGTGTLARCLQHETDHINGIVMEDHLTPAERRDIHRHHKKVAKQYPSNWPA
ncbi:peptide deformylase [Auritidibacter ignavus]|uniref:peptide deformylase n=1 Tax=Auritidibacter ignavus TaxID=678932 RepID=UPI002FE5DF09